ncbi:AAA family ATPase [Janibacter anophelis]|uniref:AAA family ATPase n=1 Tax=Janibacter anophelis TaxID=319054 RepID=UPI003F7F5172
MSVTVLTALSHGWEGKMVEVVDRLPGVTVGRRCVDLADLLAAASAGLGDLALISADLRGLDRDALSHLRAHGVAVVGASREGAESEERHLRQLGVDRHVHLATPREDLVEVLTTTAGAAPFDPTRADLMPGEDPPTAPIEPVTDLTPPPPPPLSEPTRGRVIAVWGPTGAPGRSTLAVNLASELAAAGAPTVLIDLDTYGAAVAQLLSVLDEAPGLAAAARASELGTLDLVALARLAVEVSPRFRVLTGVPTPSRWPEVRSAAVEHVIELARSLAAFVVLDTGFGIEDDEELSYDTAAPRRNAATLSGLAQADDLVLVGAADPIGLQRMVRAVQGVGQVSSPAPRPVVNRLRASSVGSDPARRVEESLARFAGVEGITFLPDDPAATDAALLAGATLAECAPDSPLRLAIAQLATTWTGAAAPTGRSSARGLLRRRG